MVMKCGCERVERRRRKRTEGCEEVSEVHGWVHRREVHGSDYKEASRGVGECEGLRGGRGGGRGVMDAGELRCGHVGGLK